MADSLASPVPVFTRRDVGVAAVPRKAVAAIGMPATGKTTLTWVEVPPRTGVRDERFNE